VAHRSSEYHARGLRPRAPTIQFCACPQNKSYLDWLNSERVMRLIGFPPSPLRPPPYLGRANHRHDAICARPKNETAPPQAAVGPVGALPESSPHTGIARQSIFNATDFHRASAGAQFSHSLGLQTRTARRPGAQKRAEAVAVMMFRRGISRAIGDSYIHTFIRHVQPSNVRHMGKKNAVFCLSLAKRGSVCSLDGSLEPFFQFSCRVSCTAPMGNGYQNLQRPH
jgi:hypothetical protein